MGRDDGPDHRTRTHDFTFENGHELPLLPATRHGGLWADVSDGCGHQVGLEIKPCRWRISPKPADYTHLSRLAVKYVLFGLWQFSEDQDRSAILIFV